MTDSPDNFYFTELSLGNVRAFKTKQSLRLVDVNGRPARWNLILGENGVGKTTLLQCLVRMRPIAAFKRDEDENSSEFSNPGAPDYVDPELAQHSNSEMTAFIRKGKSDAATITATLSNAPFWPRRKLTIKNIEVGAVIEHNNGELTNVIFSQTAHALSKHEPVVIAYGAGRHIGHSNLLTNQDRDQNQSLFTDSMDLYDAAEILGRMHYAVLNERDHNPNAKSKALDHARFEAMVSAIAALIPNATRGDIDIRGPEIPSRAKEQHGIHVRTPSGEVALTDLSIGYQTMFAWTADLAWRLFGAYPKSKTPLSEPAVVLIDEIDLHLHPRWQRSLRTHLLKHFPAVQFIATTHSPITAQESIAAGENVSVVRWKDAEATIMANPLEVKEWRVDQVLVSDLFDFETARSPSAEAKLDRRTTLIRKSRLTKAESVELDELDDFAARLPTALSPEEQRIFDALLTGAPL